ncbi:hypothetical protein LRAMOSA07030 [Lichtheimia ramosa]|uniref:Uncharacterized protein n=1 Tax=Lichtheimia ramosa TaxID=688394 RepID=A0A077WBJ2_9FUNG|nr:hypothetical protein LRAMOSA07030 [Lichtheimia ramosa]
MEILYKDTNDNALDNAISETTVPLPPIGKALHVLLNVSQHVFDEAAKNDTTQTPTARAFRALNEYLNQGQFTDIFDPLQLLKPKSSQPFLRLGRYLLLLSTHRIAFAHFIRHDLLGSSDKRLQLAGVLLLEYIVNDPISADFIPDLSRVALQYSEEPMTLLPSTACNVAVKASRHGIHDYQPIRDLIPLMKKWYPFDVIATAAWESIDNLLQSLQGPCKTWNQLSSSLSFKRLMSKKPLSVKKQLSSLNDLEPNADLITVALLQKSQWLDERLPDDLVILIQKHIASMLNVTWAQPLVMTMLLMTPGLCAVHKVPKHLIVPLAKSASMNQEQAKAFLSYAMDNTTESIHALSEMVGKDMNENAARILGDMLDNAINDNGTNLEEFSLPLVVDMLHWVCGNDLACKVLIRYMDIADLRYVLIRLVRMAYTKDPRSKQVCMALIGKTMLAGKWANGDGILIYIDMIRDMKKTHALPHRPTTSILTSPSKLSQQIPQEEMKLDDQEIERFSWELLSVLQLWVMKATPEAIQHGLHELLYRSYAAPYDSTFVHAWQNLANPVNKCHPMAVWLIMDHCTQLMKEQPKLMSDLIDAGTEESELAVSTITMKRLSPMLILRALQANTYTHIRLPAIIESEKIGWSALGIDRSSIKWDNDNDNDPNHKRISLALFRELEYRTRDPSELGEIQELARSLLSLIYCRQDQV